MVSGVNSVDTVEKVDIQDPIRIARRHRRLVWATVIFVLPIAVALALSAAYVSYFSLDLRITRDLQEISNSSFRSLMLFISWFGNNGHGIIMTLAIVVVLFLFKLRLEAGTVLLSCSVGELLSILIKTLVGRPRPSFELIQVYTQVNSKSFPSGHVFHYMALYGLLFYLVYVVMRRSILRSSLLVVFGLMVGLVGISRMYLGEHWASDVIGGYLFGFVWLILMIEFYWRMKMRRLQKTKTEPS